MAGENRAGDTNSYSGLEFDTSRGLFVALKLSRLPEKELANLFFEH